MITPRDYQLRGIEEMRKAIREGDRRILYCLPTGGGKTVVAAEVIRSAATKGKRIYFVAHRKELIDQSSSKLDDLGVPHGVIMADHPRRHPELPVQVVSIQTAIRRSMPWKPDIVFIDEAHRAAAAGYQQILKACDNPVLIGITATPIRGDNKGLGGSLFQRIIIGPSVKELIEQGYLVKPEVYSWPIDLKSVKISRGDYDQHELNDKMSESKLVGDVLREWQRRCADRTTVVFASGVGHSQILVQKFTDIGVKAAHIDGTTPKMDRESILYRLASGDIQVVSNFGVLCEGWDCPRVSALSIVRPTKSLGLYLQMAGRVLRPYPGKESTIILDHGGCARRPGFGLPEDPRQWALSEDRPPGLSSESTRDVDDRIDVCPDCGRVYEKGDVEACECGYGFSRRRKTDKKAVEAELERVESSTQIPASRQKAVYFNFLWQQIRRRKIDGTPYSEKYAAVKFKSQFGEWPPFRWLREFEAENGKMSRLRENAW